jgi:hypothetical protein
MDFKGLPFIIIGENVLDVKVAKLLMPKSIEAKLLLLSLVLTSSTM